MRPLWVSVSIRICISPPWISKLDSVPGTAGRRETVVQYRLRVLVRKGNNSQGGTSGGRGPLSNLLGLCLRCCATNPKTEMAPDVPYERSIHVIMGWRSPVSSSNQSVSSMSLCYLLVLRRFRTAARIERLHFMPTTPVHTRGSGRRKPAEASQVPLIMVRARTSYIFEHHCTSE
jgi:hypothetical protein